MFRKVCDEIAYPFPKLNGKPQSNLISHFIMDVITNPSWD